MTEALARSVETANAPWFVSARAAEELLEWRDVIDALDAAYALPHDAEANPPRSVARGKGIWFRSLTSILPSGTHMGAKIFGLGRDRAVSYAVLLFDQQTGEIAGLLDGESLTAFRTAGTSAVAARHLIPPGPVSLAILGSGREARSHLRAIAATRPINRVAVYSPSEANRREFAATFSREIGIACTAAKSADAAIEGVSVIVAAARSRDETPTFDSASVADGTFIISVGSTLPSQREIDTALIARAGVIVADAPDEVMTETGDFIAATQAGVEFRDRVISLNDVVRGTAADRIGKSRLTMFKSVGSGMQDLVVAELALKKARQRGLAVQLPAFELKSGSAKKR